MAVAMFFSNLYFEPPTSTQNQLNSETTIFSHHHFKIDIPIISPKIPSAPISHPKQSGRQSHQGVEPSRAHGRRHRRGHGAGTCAAERGQAADLSVF